jgi:hypothetical protein
MKNIWVLNITSFIFIIILAGAICNFLVIQDNQGLMPVLTKYNSMTYYTDNHHFYYNNSKEINNSNLADNYLIFDVVYSLGDLLMYFGYFLLLVFGFYLHIKNMQKNEHR